MAQSSTCFSVYVAFYLVVITLPAFIFATPAHSTSNVQPLLQPYDFLFYSGVRAYFNEDWGKAAELLEKSILAKESLFSVRRKCHDACGSAGKEALDRLGKFQVVLASVEIDILQEYFSSDRTVSKEISGRK